METTEQKKIRECQEWIVKYYGQDVTNNLFRAMARDVMVHCFGIALAILRLPSTERTTYEPWP